LIIIKPILLRVVQRIYHFWNQLVLLSNLKHSACVLVASAVVGSGENCKELPSCESLKPIHNALVSSQNILGFVVFEEEFHSVRSELDDVTCTVWISYKVWLDA